MRRTKLPFVIYSFAMLLFFASLANAERIYAKKVNELPGELQDFIEIVEATGNIVVSLGSGSTDVIHIPLVSLKSGSHLEFGIRRMNCCTKYLHTQKWSFMYTGEGNCCLDVAWTSGPEKTLSVGYEDGTSNAHAYADANATIQIDVLTVKIIGKYNDQGNAGVYCKLDAEKVTVDGDVSYNIPFSMWNVPHSNKRDCDIQLEFDGSIYKLEAQWPSRAAVKLILIGSGVGLIVFSTIIAATCILLEVWHHECCGDLFGSKETLMSSLSNRIQDFRYCPDDEMAFDTWWMRYGSIMKEDGKDLADDAMDGSIYKLEAQWPGRAAVKLILIGSGVGLIVCSTIIAATCILFEVWHHEDDVMTALSYSQNTSVSMKIRADTQSLIFNKGLGDDRRTQSGIKN